MDEGQVEKSLNELKNRIPVNEELKQQLRKSFERRLRRFTLRKWGVAGLAAAVLLLVGSFVLQGPGGIQTVAAESLQVQNQVSFIDIGSGSPLGVSEYRGTVYVPVAGKGLFAYDQNGFHQLLQSEVNEARVNLSGKKLIIASNGTLGVYDVELKKYEELLRGDGTTVYYEQPSWKDEQTILYVKKVIEPAQDHGFTVKESAIYEWALDQPTPKKLGEGSFPSYAKDKQLLVFQKETDSDSPPKIIVKEAAAGGKEMVIDDGRFPSVTPDGAYIAYVKTDVNRRELQANASVEEMVDQLWISDIDGQTKRVVTANQPNRQINEKDWLNQLKQKPSNTPMVLTHYGQFSYYNPAWSSDSQSLYVLKNGNMEGAKMTIMRIDLSTKVLGPEETVRAFNQAKIRRDHDFARSLLKEDQDLIIASNPHQVSYSIIGSGTENDRSYVDVEENWAYTANPDYSVSNVRYYLSQANRGYLIEEMKSLPGSVAVKEQVDGTITLEKDDGTKETLLSNDSIPTELRPAGKYRISSLAYLTKPNQVLFTLQTLQDPDKSQPSSVKVITYDIKIKSFKLMHDITTLNGMKNVGAENLIVSRDGRYAALDLFSDDDKQFRTHVLHLDLEHNKATMLEERITDTNVQGTHTYYWDGNQLHFILTSHEQKMYYKWNATTGTVDRP